MSKHTLGPWEIAVFPDKRIFVENSYGDGVGEVYDYANARLVAAAPDLLEALKIADGALNEDSNGQVLLEASGYVRAAIAKAEGRT